jgi:(S)-ureidoglycine aminohydrolase
MHPATTPRGTHMTHLGHTRGTLHPTHLLHTPDTFVRTPLPGLVDGLAILHASPALGARFLQFTAEIAPKGKLMPSPHQRFVLLLSGDASIIGPTLDQPISAGAFVYMPPTQPTTLIANTPCVAVVIEKAYEPLPGVPAPTAFVGHEATVKPEPLHADPDLLVRALLPAHFGFDFAVNTMTYAPGATLSQTEIHIMEHGCLMLEGAGIYKLADTYYPVHAGDFIWMASFCPQWFGALGKVPTKYLIYKDTNRPPQL